MSNPQSPENNPVQTIIETLLDFKKSEVLQTADHVIDHVVKYSHEVMDGLDEKYHIEPISIEQYLQKISPSIDEQIIKHIHQSNLQPLGGEIKLSKDTASDNILIIWEFYFSDQNKKMHKIGSRKIMDKSVFTQESYERIVQSVVFDINPPKH